MMPNFRPKHWRMRRESAASEASFSYLSVLLFLVWGSLMFLGWVLTMKLCTVWQTDCCAEYWCFMNIIFNFYRQHCTKPNAPVFNLLTGRFWGFSPSFRCCTDWGEIWHGTRSPPSCQISPKLVQRLRYRSPKTQIFTETWSKCGI